MSSNSWGPLALGIIVGLLTWWTGYGFAIGFAIGSMAGSLIFAPSTPTIDGPSLQDRRVQKSEYGAHLPVIWGWMRTTGNVEWVKGNQLDERIRRIKQGGQKIRIREYFATFLMLAADCTDGVGIDGVAKIWLNHELVYDFSEQPVFDPTTGTLIDKLAAVKMPGITFRILDGTQTTADDLIVADLGAGNVPAYTGRAGVLFVDLPLEKYGNSIPTVEMLVVRKCGTAYPPTVDLDASAITGEGSNSVQDARTGYIWKITQEPRPGAVSVFDPVSETTIATIGLGLIQQPIWDGEDVAGIGIDYVDGTAEVIVYPGWEGTVGTVRISIDLATYQIVARATGQEIVAYDPILYRNSGFYLQTIQTGLVVGGHTIYGFIKAPGTEGVLADAGESFWHAKELARWQDLSGRIYPYPVWLGLEDDGVPPTMDDLTGPLLAVSATNHLYIYNTFTWIPVMRFQAAEWTSAGLPRWAWDYNRHYLYVWDSYNVGTYFYKIDLNPDFPTAQKVLLTHDCNGIGYDPDADVLAIGYNDGLYIYRASDMALIESRTGINATGELYVPPNAAGWVIQKSTMNKIYYHQQFDTEGPPLSTVVGDVLSTVSEFEAADFDVTALTQRVGGYASGQSPRGTIDPLRQLYRFDLVEVDHQLKAVNRGGAPVAIIDWDDLGAYSDGKPASAVTITRRQEVELAKSMTLTYMDPAMDYQDSTQRATKIQTQSDHHIDAKLPVVLSSDEAARTVEILLHQDWLARTGYAISLPPKHAWLSPADVVSIPQDATESNFYTMLVGEETLGPEFLTSLKGVRDQPDIYTSTATGAAGSYTPPTVVIPYPSRLELLDINPWTPLAGYFVAVCGTRLPWPGADVLESAALAGPYDAIVTTQDAAVLGSAVTALAEASPWRTDDDNSVTVRLADPSAVLTSGLALLGDEIIHFSSAIQSGQEWTLSTLLRGRKGTDTGMTHAAGERFVLLDDNVLAISQPVSELDVAHYYRAVTRGQREETVSPVTFANGFNCLKPWSPKQATAAIGSDTVLDWERSDRLTTNWHLAVALPLSESSEAYEVDILDTDGEVIRTATGITSSTWTYTSAMQTTDGDAGVAAHIYQISATVGRGYPATVSLLRRFDLSVLGTCDTTTPWTVESGTLGTRSATPTPYEGTAYLFMGTSATSIAYQDLTIPSAILTEVDAGSALFSAEWWQAGLDGTNDKGEVIVEFLSATSTVLGTLSSGLFTTNQTWSKRSFSAQAVPANTRTVRFKIKGVRTNGTNNDAYFDSIGPVVIWVP
jgi:hypothetical protein